ncbi:MAG TPA: hypothetical protein VMT23_03275 [Candidatus Binatia bacterium]|nr:hypothetical protein [Candidatus Binatia bacterium]
MAEKRKTPASSTGQRVRKATKRQARTKAKAETRSSSAVPNSFQLTRQVLRVFKEHWKTLLGIVTVYLILNIVFASGLSNLGSTVSNIKSNLDQSSSSAHPIAQGISGFGALVGSAGSSGSSTGSILQSLLFVIESLVIIWALRQLLAGKKISVKQAYYRSMYPLIPFLLVIFVIILQLLPVTLGAAVLSNVVTSIISSLSLATWLSWIFFIVLGAWSFYMISGSIFALYIVTLPDMQPRDALRSAKKLVRYRRWQVIPKVLFLPCFILLAMAVIVVPLIIFASFAVAPVFYILSMLTILFIHTYFYSLYRSLLE